MSAFRSIVFAAALAGLIVGILVTVIQHFGTVPLIQRAEVYERQAEAGEHPHAAATPEAAHEHDAAAWEPAEGFERTAYTALFNVIDWIGFGLLLNGALVLLRRPASWREGFLWGLAAFAVFVIAPGFGLPPELPGIPAAPLLPRQIWWTATILATAVGLGLIAFRPSPLAAASAILLIVAPHLVGAPHLAEVETNVPELLSHQFIVTATLTALPCWALLGGLTGHFYRRFSAAAV
jgi:cobalt transporter subunit CbtA